MNGRIIVLAALVICLLPGTAVPGAAGTIQYGVQIGSHQPLGLFGEDFDPALGVTLVVQGDMDEPFFTGAAVSASRFTLSNTGTAGGAAVNIWVVTVRYGAYLQYTDWSLIPVAGLEGGWYVGVPRIEDSRETYDELRFGFILSPLLGLAVPLNEQWIVMGNARPDLTFYPDDTPASVLGFSLSLMFRP